MSGAIPVNVRQAAALTGCEQRLQPDRRPSVSTVAIVGAWFTAGVGAEEPAGPGPPCWPGCCTATRWWTVCPAWVTYTPARAGTGRRR